MANVFSSDANCQALYNFESGALTTDSKGTNTLTNSGVGEDKVNYKQGACSGDFDSADYMYIDDADLSADFPLKDGDTNGEISVTGWVKFDTKPALNQYGCILTKYHASTAKRSFAVGVKNISGSTRFILVTGHGGGVGALVYTFTSFSVSTGVWYHFAMTARDSDKAYSIRVYSESLGSALGKTGTLTYNLNIEDAQVRIGLPASFDGTCVLDARVDEIAIFNDILTFDEIDEIRGGTYLVNLLVVGEATATASITGLTFITPAFISGVFSATVEITGTADTKERFVPARRGDYDPDTFWDEETKAWVASQPIEKLAGGRHKTYLVVVSDRNLIYVGGL